MIELISRACKTPLVGAGYEKDERGAQVMLVIVEVEVLFRVLEDLSEVNKRET